MLLARHTLEWTIDLSWLFQPNMDMTHCTSLTGEITAMFKSLFLSAAFLTLSVTALAQQGPQAPPVGFSGALVEYSDTSVTLKDKDGKVVTVGMTPGWFVSSPKKITADVVKPGDFVATANTNVDANTGKSTELRVMEPNYRPEEGTHLMEGRPNTSMTHGTVKKTTKGSAGLELDVAYSNGGSRRIIVPPEINVTGYDVYDRSVLKPGMNVSAVTRKSADGVLRGGRLTIASPAH
jgi:hypothetical protein